MYIYTYMFVYIHIHIYLCIYIYIFICTYIYLFICIHIKVYLYIITYTCNFCINRYICHFTCMIFCIYIYIHIYIYTYICAAYNFILYLYIYMYPPFNPGIFGEGRTRNFSEIFHLTTWNIPPPHAFWASEEVGGVLRMPHFSPQPSLLWTK